MEKISNKNKELKINLRNHLYALLPLIIFSMIITLGVYLFYQRYGLPDNTMVRLMVLLYLVFALPAIILHFEYIINDWNVSLSIDNINKQITYRKGKQKITFTFDEIDNIYFFGETKEFNNLTTQNHSFYFIKVKNNEPFIVSCLIVRNIENVIRKVIVIKTRRLFPSILLEETIAKKKKV